MTRIELPEAVENIIRRLENHGHEAFAVGGCVRDCILGKKPDDWDITTSASPAEVKAVFPRTVDTGIRHGTVTVLLGGRGYEVTTYRIDGEYKDGRHPEHVTFTSDLLEDLKRRDFTINAMAYHPDRGLIDEFGGQEDLREGIIRAVGDPAQRFTEDALRMMRAVRFSARFGFTIEDRTYQAITDLAQGLARVSAERIRVEFEKTIVSPHPEAIRTLHSTGLTQIFLPEWDVMARTPQHTPHHIYDVAEHTVQVMLHVPSEKRLRLAALFHDFGKPEKRTTDADGTDHFKGHPAASAEMARRIMKRLRYDNATIAAVTQLVRWHDERPADSDASVRQAIARIGIDAFPDLFTLKRADTLGQSMYRRAEKLQAIDRFEARWREIIERHDPLTVHDLALTGTDLIEAGLAKGPEIGVMLRQLLMNVLGDPSLNTREKLLHIAAGIRGSGT